MSRAAFTGGRRTSDAAAEGPRRLVGLDALRGLAVLGVLAYHAGLQRARGGFLGVDLFFVISGFLITYLLLRERVLRGSIRFGAFYARRARRLLPALFGMLAVLVGVLALFFPGDLREARGDVAAALGYFSNWWYVVHHRSYFVAMGRPQPLQHLWSLAVEEQFYLVWPAVIALVCVARVRRRLLMAVALFGALASAWWMRHLAISGNVPYDTDASRLYFGTDTHASALLVGAAAAALIASVRGAEIPSRRWRWIRFGLEGAGLAGVAAVVWAMISVSEFSPTLYRGGFLAFAVAAAVVVTVASRPGSVLGRALDTPALRWIGLRSYGLYLWHWPVFVYTRPGLDWPLHGWTALGARLAITFGLTEISYRVLEQPIRRHGWRVVLRLPRLAPSAVATPIVVGTAVVALTAVLPSVVVRTITARSPAVATVVPGGAPTLPQPTDPSPPPTSPSATPDPSPTTAAAPTPTVSHTHAPRSTVTSRPSTSAGSAAGSNPPASPPPVTAVGDSVLIDAADALRRVCPGVEVDAAIGWQAHRIFAELQGLRAAGRLGQIVIIEAGTNGPVSPEELSQTLSMLADRQRVVLVNNHMDRPWKPQNNALFSQAVKDHPNAAVADWDALADQHPQWLTPDGVHLLPEGNAPYANLLAQAAGC
ncbi:MAG: acetyltransferase [Acidothermus sp.]|nr:acetyltransferase [Acidothermus sp.]